MGFAPGGLPEGQADGLDVDVGVGQALADRLEAADGLIELLSGAGVFAGHFEGPFENAELPGAGGEGGASGGPGRGTGCDDDVLPGDRYVAQLEQGRVGAVDQVLPGDGEPRGVSIQQDQYRIRVAAGLDQEGVGEGGGRDGRLCAGERPAAFPGPGFEGGEVAGEHRGQRGFAAQQRRHPASDLVVVAELGQRGRADGDARGIRCGSDGPADLGQDRALLEHAVAAAVDPFGQGGLQ
ncbi:hypothetical protein NS14008_13515 [Nocardia seriolae]|nr:hypothetical protein NS14008_13515 [Nocardia seriolae]